jgi:APA family basic amino acid/polyamine antiporter
MVFCDLDRIFRVLPGSGLPGSGGEKRLSYIYRFKPFPHLKRKISVWTAASIVVANMIGTGVFTSVGFQLSAVQNTWSIVLLWIVGGILGLFGAFAYAELGTHFKTSGGDYVFLSEVFHPVLGFLTAWAGLTVGFSAPVALAAIAITKYLAPFGLNGNISLALGIIVLVSLMHSFTIKHSSGMQNISTLVKVLFMVVLIVIGFALPGQEHNAIRLDGTWKQEIWKTGYAISMVFVTFAYSGWNASAYIVEEIKDPKRNIPRSLIGSTLFISLLYVLFQVVLLRNGSVEQMAGKEDVSFIAFNNLLGEQGGKWVSFFIALQLVATISSYLWVGPRVTWAMAKKHPTWKPLSRVNKHGIPVRAVWLHAFMAIVLTATGSFEKVLLYAGFVLQLVLSLTVASSLFIKDREKDNFLAPFHPWPQVIYLLFSLWILVYTMIDKPWESLAGFGILGIGLLFYLYDRKVSRQ